MAFGFGTDGQKQGADLQEQQRAKKAKKEIQRMEIVKLVILFDYCYIVI